MAKKKVAASKKKATARKKTPPEARAVGEHELTILPDEPVVEAAPEPELPKLVACRYCGTAIFKPADGSTFYTCGCVDTGSLATDKFGKAVPA